MKWLRKLQQVLHPERMYKVNLGGAIFNLVCAFACWGIALPAAYAQIFIASGLCFLVGALANFWMVKIQKKK